MDAFDIADLRAYTTRGVADLKTKSVLLGVLDELIKPVSANVFVDVMDPAESREFADRFNAIIESRLDNTRAALVKDRSQCDRIAEVLSERRGAIDGIIGLLRPPEEN